MSDHRVMRADLVCMSCGRTAATATRWPWGLVLAPVDGADPEAVRALRCPFCLGRPGRLWMEYAREEVVHKRLSPAATERPRPGRPRKGAAS